MPALPRPGSVTDHTVMRAVAKPDWDGLQAGFYDFLGHVTIVSKDEGRVQLEMYDAQRYFFDEIFDGLRADIHWFVCGKGRQLGITTACLLFDVFYAGAVPDIQAGFVVDTESNKNKFRKLLKEMIVTLPPSHTLPIAKGGDNRDGLTLKNGNMLDYLTAGTKRGQGTLGRSRALNFVHACMAPGTPIVVTDGRVKLIEHVQIGDRVLTHTGVPTTVIDVFGQPNNKGHLIRITPWLGQALDFTLEHTIPTRRGVVTAAEVREDDELVMPVRPIGGVTQQIVIPISTRLHQNGTRVLCRQSVGAGMTLALDQEVGFSIGYYLAEGNISHERSTGWACGIQFSHHRSERDYAERAIKAIEHFVSPNWRTVDRENCYTSVTQVYGAALAQWVCASFGELKEKRIPDQVFEWGKDFCEGLLIGLLAGDGSKNVRMTQGYPLNQVVLVSTRASIALQARDIAASLGYGWGAVRYVPPAERQGRIEQAQWRVIWNGTAAANLRALLGFPVYPTQPKSEKYRIEGGQVFLKIREIERDIECDEIWDISVEHDDHTLRTPYMAVGNTECRSYGDDEALETFKDSLSEIFPWRLYLWESTGYGYNLFYDLWEEAIADEISKRAIFVTWWRKRTYAYRRNTPLFQRYGWPERSKEETEAEEIVLRDYGHQITTEQWAWYRHRADPIARAEERNDEELASERQDIVTQEHPHFPDQMFRGTGSPFIPNEYIAPALHRAQALVFRGYRYHLGDDVSAMTIVPVKYVKFAQLKVYEPPSPIGVYIIGADTAYGISERGDANCAQVVRVFADKMVQVAEFNDRNIQPFQFAWVLLHLCGWYGMCRYVLELNGSGEAVWTELKTLKRMVEDGKLVPPRFAPEDLMETLPGPEEEGPPSNDIRHAYQHVTQYLYRRSDALGGSGYNWHMRTSLESKYTYMTQFADRFMLDECTINSVPALEEMKRMRKDGREISAEGRAKDDRPIALGLATRAYIDDERKKMVARNATYAAEMQREADGAGNDTMAARYMALIMRQTMDGKNRDRRQRVRAERRQRWSW